MVDAVFDPLVAPSAVPSLLAGTFNFGVGLTTSYPLNIQNDDIALENDEIALLFLSSPLDSQVVVGGSVDGVPFYSNTTLIITDDDCEYTLCT